MVMLHNWNIMIVAYLLFEEKTKGRWGLVQLYWNSPLGINLIVLNEVAFIRIPIGP